MRNKKGTYKNAVIDSKKEADAEIKEIEAHKETPDFANQSEDEQEFISERLELLKGWSKTLGKRIDNFGDPVKSK